MKSWPKWSQDYSVIEICDIAEWSYPAVETRPSRKPSERKISYLPGTPTVEAHLICLNDSNHMIIGTENNSTFFRPHHVL